MQWGSDESIINRKTHVVTLTGNAFIYREKEVLRADRIQLNTLTSFAHAEGRVDYQYAEFYIHADAIDVDLKTKTGTIINGNISNGKFALKGSRIDQVEPNHFLVKDYNYTTCYDCPTSWELTGSDVDMTLDQYAYIKNFAFKVKDAPVFWSPYMIIPVKTKRQTGFLFPKFGRTSDFGTYVVAPFYWAINKSSDMTVGIGDYSERGFRFEWEGRYALSPRSQGIANVYFTHDTEVAPLNTRWAAKGAFTQELPFGVEGKLHLNEVSDVAYPIRYSNDIDGRQQPVLSSDLFFSKNDPSLSTTVSFRRIRNLLKYSQANDGKALPDSGFDPLTVQEFPRITMTSNDRLIFGQKVAAGVEARFNRFAREGGPIDTIDPSGNKPIILAREANRFTLIPNLYTALNPFPWLSLVPSLQYRSYFYNFSNTPDYPNLARGYLLAQIETSVQFEKMFATENPNVSYRHTITPKLTYSNIPDQLKFASGSSKNGAANHPFTDQTNGGAGQYFDNSDLIPLHAIRNLDSYVTPLGNTLTYGLTSQLFKREVQKDGTVKASRRMEASIEQTLDIYEARRALDSKNQIRILTSPLFANFLYQNEKVTATLEYTYYSYLDAYNSADSVLVPLPNPHRFSTAVTWTAEHAVKDNLLTFDRSISLGYSFAKLTSKVSSLQISANFSINDYLMPKGSISYNLVTNANPVILEVRGSLLYQSPSKCWQTEVGLFHSIDQHSGIIFNLALNVAGDSYTATR